MIWVQTHTRYYTLYHTQKNHGKMTEGIDFSTNQSHYHGYLIVNEKQHTPFFRSHFSKNNRNGLNGRKGKASGKCGNSKKYRIEPPPPNSDSCTYTTSLNRISTAFIFLYFNGMIQNLTTDGKFPLSCK